MNTYISMYECIYERTGKQVESRRRRLFFIFFFGSVASWKSTSGIFTHFQYMYVYVCSRVSALFMYIHAPALVYVHGWLFVCVCVFGVFIYLLCFCFADARQQQQQRSSDLTTYECVPCVYIWVYAPVFAFCCIYFYSILFTLFLFILFWFHFACWRKPIDSMRAMWG